jgi:formylglycine-generating enzyme required for sulfatase activity
MRKVVIWLPFVLVYGFWAARQVRPEELKPAQTSSKEGLTETAAEPPAGFSREMAAPETAGESFRDCPECPEMVAAPAGRFMMGRPRPADWEAYEHGPDFGGVPYHEETIAKPFAVGIYSVTFQEWDTCVAEGGCREYRPADQGWGRGQRPVINVNWRDANAFIAWLSAKTGKSYRLPTEAEREYITRAGTTANYWWGNDISPVQANYCTKEPLSVGLHWRLLEKQKTDCQGRTLPVKSFAANPWGLYQVHGNVLEWTSSFFFDGGTQPALRGGSWNDFDFELCSACRTFRDPEMRSFKIGFRVARTLSPQAAPPSSR